MATELNEMPKCMLDVGGKPVLERIANKMEKNGISKIIGNLHSYPSKVMEYFGQQNELASGLHVKNPMGKPDVLLDYERCKRYGVLLEGGGLNDQPHLWLLEQDIVREIITLFDAMPKLTLGAK